MRFFPLQEDEVSSQDGSYREAVKAHYANLKGTDYDSLEAQKMCKDNYCVIDAVIPLPILGLMEEYMNCRGAVGDRKKENMFCKVVNGKVQHDDSRQLYNCAFDWIMYHLIAVLVTSALKKHGVLGMVDLDSDRMAKIVTWIESRSQEGNPEDKKLRDQAFHEDFAHYLAKFFAEEYGVSVLVGCTEGSEVHVIPASFGGSDEPDVEGKKGERVFTTVKLARGQALVMGPGLIHRGVGYIKRNVRLFVAFLGGRSCKSSFFNTYNVESTTNESGATVVA